MNTNEANAAPRDPLYDNFYYIFPDRWMPDQYDRTLREIFPDQHPGGFSQLEDGRWVWTTFNSFQWDLNYSNPWVFRAYGRRNDVPCQLGR